MAKPRNHEPENMPPPGPEVSQRAIVVKMPPPALPELINGFDILNGDFPEPEFLFAGLLAKGVTFCCGRPKTGKSWLTLQLAIAAASQTPAFGRFRPKRAFKVLYCGLEEPKSRTRSRYRKFIKPGTQLEESTRNMQWLYQLDPLLAGGATTIDGLVERDKYDLVIIDTFLKVLQPGKSRDLLRSDYSEVAILSEIAKKHDIAIVVVHHTRKMAAENPLDQIAGSTGLSAAFDSSWVLNRKPDNTAVLQIQGRDMEDREIELKWCGNDRPVHDEEELEPVHDEKAEREQHEQFGWVYVGSGSEVGMSDQRREILDCLRSEGPMTPKEIAQAIGNKPRSTVRRLLQELAKNSLVTMMTGNKYKVQGEG